MPIVDLILPRDALPHPALDALASNLSQALLHSTCPVTTPAPRADICIYSLPENPTVQPRSKGR
jgi:hypothetical protein